MAPHQPDRLYLHVGAPKSGTTYIQTRLRRNAVSLHRHGVLVPATPWWSTAGDLHFRAALDLTGQDFGGPPGHAQGAWIQFARQVRRHRGTALMSHELLATAAEEVVTRVRQDLPGKELHMVFTARDPARTLPAAWQEAVKLGRSASFRRFLRNARQRKAWLVRAMAVPEVVGAWSDLLGPDRVHLVVVPPSRDEPDLLWHRFSNAIDIDPVWWPEPPEDDNASLGIAETQLLRHVNHHFGSHRQRGHRANWVIKNVVAEGALASRQTTRIQLPPDEHEWVAALAEEWIGWLRSHEVEVHGDLAELRPRPPVPPEEWCDPDDAPSEELAGAALDALTAALTEVVRRPAPEEHRFRRAWTRLRRR